MSMKPTTLDGKEIEFVIELVVTTNGTTNSVNLNQLDVNPGPKVLVVNEFPNVYTKELTIIPPERDIEFVIEIVSGTAPIGWM
jgi:hypothetical protein